MKIPIVARIVTGYHKQNHITSTSTPTDEGKSTKSLDGMHRKQKLKNSSEKRTKPHIYTSPKSKLYELSLSPYPLTCINFPPKSAFYIPLIAYINIFLQPVLNLKSTILHSRLLNFQKKNRNFGIYGSTPHTPLPKKNTEMHRETTAMLARDFEKQKTKKNKKGKLNNLLARATIAATTILHSHDQRTKPRLLSRNPLPQPRSKRQMKRSKFRIYRSTGSKSTPPTKEKNNNSSLNRFRSKDKIEKSGEMYVTVYAPTPSRVFAK